MNHTEETWAADEGFGREGTPRGRPLARVLLSALFLLSSLLLGLFWFVVLVGLLLAGLPLAIIWVGLPIVAFAAAVCVVGTGVERWRLGALLGAHLSSPYRPLPRGSVLARAADPALWRGLLYLLLLLPIGVVELVIVLLLAFSAALATYPLWFWTQPEGRGITLTEAFVADTLPEALLVMLFGLVLASAAAAFGAQACQAHAALGGRLLGPSKLDERVEALTEGRSKAVEAAITERRRIERDLHDGAQ